MKVGDDILGTCLECETPIIESQLMLTYETDETVIVLAKCPSCRKITYPG